MRDAIGIMIHADNGMIVRFPDEDTALAWYNSPTYQALLDIRNAALDCRFRLVG